ncbi:hypothetical protein EV562_10197 [Streptomyces sp. BK208]|nr:hypothetical protein EV562_10197 [Streptomyces sp. BK208]
MNAAAYRRRARPDGQTGKLKADEHAATQLWRGRSGGQMPRSSAIFFSWVIVFIALGHPA